MVDSNNRKARRATLRLLYKNKDITEDVTPDLRSATWTDKSGKEVDEFSVTLKNDHGRWQGDWIPAKGARLEALIEVRDWRDFGDRSTLPCGSFQIDEIEVRKDDSGSTVTIKAVSSPITSKLRGNAKTRAWDDVRLSRIAEDIAEAAGLRLRFEMPSDPLYQREEQREETDLTFLEGLCTEAGASLKVSHDQLIVFSREEREKESTVLTITPESIAAVTLKTKSSQVYSSVRIQYHDPEANEDREYTHNAELANLGGEDENNRTLVINQRCKNLAEAERIASSMLYDNNRFEVSGSFTQIGDTRIVAGVNLALSGFGRFSGKYTVESVTHTIGEGYQVNAQIRRVISSGKTTDTDKEAGWRDFSAYGEDFYK